MLKAQENTHPLNSQNDAKTFPDILKLLKLAQPDIGNASAFADAFEVDPFQLGEPLGKPNNGDFYLVCQGRVRLLAPDITGNREVSAMVLESGETFGADNLWCDISLPYQAIAASEGIIARIRDSQLQRWLEKLPRLQADLKEQAIERQRLIFFKTATDLRRLPSHKLRELLPYLEETKITAGESLARTSASGRFWLRSGEIHSPEQDVNLTIAVGESWGHPHSKTTASIAKTDLWVYKLPTEHWKAAHAIAPAQFNGSENVASSKTEVKKSRPKSHYVAVNQQPQPASPEKYTPNPPEDSEPTSIAFPTPAAHRRLFWQGYPFIRQQSASDCGATCLSMIAQYWGKRFSLNFLRELANVGRAGASLKSLAIAAEKLGFHARPVRASLGRVLEQQNPWIAHWQGDHYVVVYPKKGKRILIADPGFGKRELTHSEFQASWTGYALLLDLTKQFPAREPNSPSIDFWGLIWPYRTVVWQIIGATLLLQIFGLVTPLFTQIILDQVIVHKSFTTLHVFAVGLLLFGIWSIGLGAIRQYLLYYLANRLDLSLIGGFISHALMLPVKFFESRHVGDIVTRVSENQKIQAFLTRQAVTAVLDVVMTVVYVTLMLYYNWQLTLLVLALIPPIIILTVAANPFLRRVSREIFNEEAAQNSALVEMMTGIATVKASAAEQELRWRWEDLLTSTLNARFRGQKLANNLQATSGLINTLGSTALLWYGATLVIQEQLSIGQFVAFNMLIGNVIGPILALVRLWDEFQEVLVSVERLNDIFSAQPEESPQKPLLVLPRLQGDVSLDNVTFRYNTDEQRNTLQNISFEARAGQNIAIVGRSGSGKTTLVKLLQGLYHPTNGRIWMDGHDIRHTSPQSLRSQLGVVPQECFLFSGTILENITLYRSEYVLEEVVTVAKLAEAHTFIQELPLGYNTKVGERGSNLSGGQRQRIAIARALLGDPPVLILDEATSSLDTDSERRFQQNLARISRDRTTFIIAHRLSTVRNADCILVLDKGILVERGTHDELIALQGLYYHLAQQQLDL